MFFSLFVLVAPSATIDGVCYLVPVASINWCSFALTLRLMSNTEVGSGSVARPLPVCELVMHLGFPQLNDAILRLTEACPWLGAVGHKPNKESSSILPVSFLFSKSLIEGRGAAESEFSTKGGTFSGSARCHWLGFRRWRGWGALGLGSR